METFGQNPNTNTAPAMSIPLLGIGSHRHPYQYHRATSGDDVDEGNEPTRHTRSTSIVGFINPDKNINPTVENSKRQDLTTSPERLYSNMEIPGSPDSHNGHDEGFQWQAPISERGSGNGGSKSAGKRAILVTPEETADPRALGGGYRTPDLDSLLERPVLADEPSACSSGKGHRKINSDGSIMSEASSVSGVTSRKEKRKSLPATIGEKAFKSPILMKSSTTNTASRNMDPHEIIDQRAELTATWGIYWYLPSLMVAVFIAGLIGALGHHAFYKSLDGKRSVNQLSMVRIGTAFAFFVKANLVGAVVLAYRQRIWFTMRRKEMRLKAIDALFGVIEDPTFFITTPEMIKNAKLASVMALVTWLIPIASVLSPSSLTSEVSLIDADGICKVPVLNFAAENDYNFQTATRFFGNSLAFYNYTDMVRRTGESSYDMPSYTSQRLASQAIYNNGSVGPASTPCEAYNCTYTVTMRGPGYKCENVSEDSVLYNRMPQMVRKENLVPNGMYIYYANVTNGDFLRPQNESTSNPQNVDPDWIAGTFLYEPELWIGYVVNTTEKLPEPIVVNATDQDRNVINTFEYKLQPETFHCVHYHVDYTFDVSFVNTQQRVKVHKIDYIRPVIDTIYGDPDPRGGGIILPDPKNFLRPGQKDYKLVSVYHAIGVHLRKFLKGKIYMDKNIPYTMSEISMTNLVDQETAFTIPNLAAGIKKLHEDILITLWGAGNLVISKEEEVPCKMTRYSNRFKYYAQNLWIGYSIVVAVTLASVIVGAHSLGSNGISSDTLFSRILVTTRNPTLDHLSRGACLGSDPFPRELEETKLRFGVWHEGEALNVTGLGLSGMDGKPGHCAFGTIHETTEIVKGGLYAGLPLPRIRGGLGYLDLDNDSMSDEEEEEEEDIFYNLEPEEERKVPFLACGNRLSE